MKKLTALIMSLALLCGLAACGNASTPNDPPATAAPETAEQPNVGTSESALSAPTETEAEVMPESGKTLVVYFSGSGNTKRVAESIAEAADADLFAIVPAEAYTDADLNWRDADSRVNREHDDEALRDVALTAAEVPDWAAYDTVYIGYPIWWGIAAWPVSSFVKANDFTGKTVIPFATSSSSGMGQSGTLLAELAGTGDWQEGRRFPSDASSADVQEWVNELK